MAITHTINENWQGSNGATQLGNVSLSANFELNADEALAGSTANQHVVFPFPHGGSGVSFWMMLDQPCTVYVNDVSGGAPIKTIAMDGVTPFVWHNKMNISNPFSADVADLYITVAGATGPNLKIRTLKN